MFGDIKVEGELGVSIENVLHEENTLGRYHTEGGAMSLHNMSLGYILVR